MNSIDPIMRNSSYAWGKIDAQLEGLGIAFEEFLIDKIGCIVAVQHVLHKQKNPSLKITVKRTPKMALAS